MVRSNCDIRNIFQSQMNFVQNQGQIYTHCFFAFKFNTFIQFCNRVIAQLNSEGLYKREWSLSASDECLEYNTGTILLIADTHEDRSLINEYISDECMPKSNGNSFGLTIQSNRTSSIPSKEDKQQECQIVIQYQFKECKVYLVQIIPDNDSLQGRI